MTHRSSPHYHTMCDAHTTNNEATQHREGGQVPYVFYVCGLLCLTQPGTIAMIDKQTKRKALLSSQCVRFGEAKQIQGG